MLLPCCALARWSATGVHKPVFVNSSCKFKLLLNFQVKRRLNTTPIAKIGRSSLSGTTHLNRHLIFFGSDSFSIGVFRELLTQYRPHLSGIEACVVGHHVLFAKYLSTYHPDIPIHVWPTLPAVERQDSRKFALVASFGKLIPESFISLLPNRIFNIHPSLLPRWRGAAPMPRCVLAGDLVVGVSIVEIAPRRFDVGKVLLQQELVPNSQMKIDQLSNTLATMGVRLLVEGVLTDIEAAVAKAKDQTTLPYKSTLARRLGTFDLNIDWARMKAVDIVRLFAATLASDHHHKNVTGQLRTSFDGHAIRLIHMDLMPALDMSSEEDDGDAIVAKYYNNNGENKNNNSEDEKVAPGRIIFDVKHRDRLLVKTMRGWVSIRRLIYKKPMSAADFYNGYLSKKPESAHYFE